MRALSFILIAAAITGCEFSDASDTGGVAVSCAKMACNGTPDALQTCNGSQDAYDCALLQLAPAMSEPDPMIFKAQMSLESGFNVFAISPDMPCAPKPGWTADEAKSFGLLQLTPACGWLSKALLPNGHPNLTKDMNVAAWATSVFNPALNVEEGVRAIPVNRQSVMKAFPGCTVAQYTMMALAGFNQGMGSVMGCGKYSPNGLNYVNSVFVRYDSLARAAAWPNPY
jgi:hypothetical protein